MENLIIEINEDCGDTNTNLILESLGYQELDPTYGQRYYKDGKTYKFVEWNHYNSFVYSITLKEVERQDFVLAEAKKIFKEITETEFLGDKNKMLSNLMVMLEKEYKCINKNTNVEVNSLYEDISSAIKK